MLRHITERLDSVRHHAIHEAKMVRIRSMRGGDFRQIAPALLIALSLLPSAVATWQLRDMPHLGSLHDDGIYWVTAGSLADRHEYRITSLPGEPWQTKYPPAYSTYLSLAWIANPSFPSNLPLAALLTWLWFPVFAAGAWRFFRSAGFGHRQAAVLTAVAATLPQTIVTANFLMSDIMFAALLLWCLDRSETNPATAGVLAGLAYLTRTAALPLLLALPVAYLLHRRRRAALIFVLSTLPFAAGWHIWCAWRAAPGLDEVTLYYTNYLTYQLQTVPFAQLPMHMWTNAGHLVNSISTLLAIDAGDSPGFSTLRPLFVVACISGIVRITRRDRAVAYALFGLVYATILIPWYYAPGRRFLVPLLPLLLAGAWTEGAHILAIVGQSWRKARVAAAVLVGALASLTVLFGWNVALQYRTSGPHALAAERELRDQLAPTYRWIRANTPPDAVFFAVNDPVFYLHTGRHALRRGRMNDVFVRTPPGTMQLSAGFRDFVRTHKVTHVLITTGDFDPPITALNLNLANTGFTAVFQNNAGVILDTQTASLSGTGLATHNHKN